MPQLAISAGNDFYYYQLIIRHSGQITLPSNNEAACTKFFESSHVCTPDQWLEALESQICCSFWR